MPKKKTQTEAEWAEMVDKLMTEFVARRSGLDHVERRRIRDRIQDLTLSEKIDMTPQDTRLMLNDIIVDAAKADVVEAKADVVKAKEKWKAEDAAAAKAKEKRFSLKPAESVCGRVRLRELEQEKQQSEHAIVEAYMARAWAQLRLAELQRAALADAAAAKAKKRKRDAKRERKTKGRRLPTKRKRRSTKRKKPTKRKRQSKRRSRGKRVKR